MDINKMSEAEERMRRETMKPNHRVALDHDFYTNNTAACKRMMAAVNEARRDVGGDAVGYFGRQETDNYTKDMQRPKKLKRAVGGVAKVRKGYPRT